MGTTDTCFSNQVGSKAQSRTHMRGRRKKTACAIDYILVRQQDQNLVRNVPVHPKMKSDRQPVPNYICLLRPRAPNRRPKPGCRSGGVRLVLTSRRRSISIVSQAVVVKLLGATNLTAFLDVENIISVFVNALRKMVADILPRCPEHFPPSVFSEPLHRLRNTCSGRMTKGSVHGRTYAPAPTILAGELR